MNERLLSRRSTPVALPPDPIMRGKPPGFSHFLLPLFLIVATHTMAGEPVPGRAAARGMAVIGPERFHQAIKPFLAHTNKERPTEWVSLESIFTSTSGADHPERLKRWLYRGWKERGLRYVLLVGDADLVPVRYMVLDRITPPAFDYAFYPSDLYYADIARREGSFDDWNARKDDSPAGYHAPPPPPAPYARGKDNQTGLGERMVRGGPAGALAYIGCNTGGQPCALTLVDGFVRALHDLSEPTLGECWVRSIDHDFHAEHLDTIRPDEGWHPPSIFFQGMKYMVLGDPARRLPPPVKR
ncbi:MAG: C25 family cysteine peptidase [Isosphaeraceae bacterium]